MQSLHIAISQNVWLNLHIHYSLTQSYTRMLRVLCSKVHNGLFAKFIIGTVSMDAHKSNAKNIHVINDGNQALLSKRIKTVWFSTCMHNFPYFFIFSHQWVMKKMFFSPTKSIPLLKSFTRSTISIRLLYSPVGIMLALFSIKKIISNWIEWRKKRLTREKIHSNFHFNWMSNKTVAEPVTCINIETYQYQLITLLFNNIWFNI